jgi:putative tryptophan/tyrosine transport system substrate-binding protein
MRRRDLLPLALAMLWGSVLDAQAQAMPRIAYLSSADLPNSYFDALLQGLRERGFIEGQNLVIERRHAQTPDEFLAAARDLVQLKAEVIVTTGSVPTRAAKDATVAAGSRIPVVFASAGDPVGKGFVASLARPGGNVTGFALLEETLPKLMEIARELVPQARSVAFMFEEAVVPPARRVSREQEYRTAAATLGLEYHELPLPPQGGLVPAFDKAARSGIDVLLVDDTILTKQHLDQIVALAAERRLPTIYRERPFVAAGGLASYGEDIHDLFRRSASHVIRLLKGERPENLPVEQPTKFELIINLKAAKALGLHISSSVLALADEVIE